MILLHNLTRTRLSASLRKAYVRTGIWLLFACALPQALQAKYVGADHRVCVDCEKTCPSCSASAGSDMSFTRANLHEEIILTQLKSAGGPALRFAVAYDSHNADGSRAAIDTGLGYGWTHSYNILRSAAFELVPP